MDSGGGVCRRGVVVVGTGFCSLAWAAVGIPLAWGIWLHSRSGYLFK